MQKNSKAPGRSFRPSSAAALVLDHFSEALGVSASAVVEMALREFAAARGFDAAAELRQRAQVGGGDTGG